MNTCPHSPARTRNLTVLAFLVACVGTLVFPASRILADMVETYDGRRFQGKVLEETSSIVRIDAMVAGIRVELGIPRRQVSSVRKTPLPENFFTPKPKVSAAPSKAAKFPPGTTLYLEVPVVGRFGAQVTAAGIKKALAHAAVNKTRHVVFFVDSQGGDRVAAAEIYEILGQYADRMTYHAIVRDAVGVSIAVTVFCKVVFMLPGANLGDVIFNTNTQADGENAQVLLSQTAYEVGQKAEAHGWNAALVRAMIDPKQTLAAWMQEDGKPAIGVRLPASVPRSKVIIQNGPDSVVRLTRSQAVKLGLAREFNGTAADLGPALGLEKWTKESDYGQTAVMSSAREKQEKMARTATRNELKIKNLLKRREKARSYLERNLKLANAWDPEQATYSTYSEYKSKWDSYWGGNPIGQTITAPRWRELTDYTLAALNEAYKAVRTLERLDDDGEKLGLKPSYPDGKLQKIKDDIEVKAKLLQFWRNRKTSAS